MSFKALQRFLPGMLKRYMNVSRNMMTRSSIALASTSSVTTVGKETTASILLLSATSAYLWTNNDSKAYCDVDILGLGKITKEPATGIMFPQLCNGMTFVGCGVRVKWGFIKVYAVGTYIDPIAMSAVKNRGDAEITKALLDPNYPRTIRIVLARNLSAKKFTDAIVEALEPRMKGLDLDKLEEFKKMNPAVDLVEGSEIEITIRGDTMLFKNGVGSVGQIQSEAFCRAMCDVYFGTETVSPALKESVLKGVSAL